MTMICKGFIYFNQGEYDNSEIYFANIADNERSNSNLNKHVIVLAKIGRALNFYNKANYSKAADIFISLIKDYDFINENILESLAICYYNLGKLKKAKDIFMKILSVNPENYKTLTYLAILDLSEIQKNPDSLDRIFKNLKNAYILDDDSEFHFLLITMTNIFLMCDKIAEAEELCTKLNKILEYGEMKASKKESKEKYRKDFDEIKSAIYCVNAKLNHLKRNYSEAFNWYTRAVQTNARNIEAQFGLGQLYLNMTNYTEAEKCFEICKNDPETINSFEVNKYLAFIYARTKKKQLDNTIDLFKKAIEIKNDDTDCYIELAQLLEFKKPEESLKLYQDVLILIRENPDQNNNKLYNTKDIMPELLNNIAAIKIRLGHTSEVEGIINEALSYLKKRNTTELNEDEKIHRTSLELTLCFNLAVYYENKNEFGDAYNNYKKIIGANPYFVDAYIKLGLLAKMRGNKAKAFDYYKQAIDKHFTNPGTKDQKIIPVMGKPITPLLLTAHLHLQNGSENEALNTLNDIVKHYDDKDIYTLVFFGNIFYELAIQIRSKQSEFNSRLGRALELYIQAIELDKYNSYAANGIANVLAEFNMGSQALDTYKNITEKHQNNHNAFINEALIYINDNKFEKASIILNKLLKKHFNNNNQEVENLLAKTYIDMKDFDKAVKVLKDLIFKHPENIYYKFNYALCLRAKSEEILMRNERRVEETEDAIRNLEKAIPIFNEACCMRKEVNSNFRNEKEEKFYKSVEFLYKCSEVLEASKLSLTNANEILENDKIRQQGIINKIEENRKRFTQILANQKEMDEKQQEELRKKMEENEKLAESVKQMAEIITQKKAELQVQQAAKKKGAKKDDNFVIENKEESSIKAGNDDGESQSESRKKVLLL
jgi:tetratricopeptide (TPR) repeat protein